MKKIKFIIIIFLFPAIVFTQNKIIDSLKQQKSKLVISESLIDLELKLAAEFWNINIDSSLYYAETAKKSAYELDYNKGKAKAYSTIGMANINKSDYHTAQINLERALEIAEKHKYKSVIAAVNNNIGILYYYQKEYYSSFKYYKKSLLLNREIGKKENIASSLQNIGTIFYATQNYDQALKYALEAFEINKELNIASSLAANANNLATYYIKTEKYTEAMEILDYSLSLSIPNKNYISEGFSYMHYTYILIKLKRYEEAEIYAHKCIEVSKKTNLVPIEADAYSQLGEIYLDTNQPEKAITYAKKGLDLSESANREKNGLIASKTLYLAHKELGNIAETAKYAEMYIDKKDFREKEKEENLDNAQFDFEIKEFEFEQRKQLEVERRKRAQIIAACAFAVLMFILFLISYKNRKLKKAYVAVKHSNAAKSNFLAKISHEIKTPCNAIVGYTDLLDGTQLNAEQKGLVKVINDASSNLLLMFQELIDFSNLKNNRGKLLLYNQNLEEFISEVKALVYLQAIEKQIDLRVDFDKNIKDCVKIDKIKLQQVLINLLNNAIKFTNSGFVHLKVNLTNSSPNKYTILFEVIDSGIGINPNNVKKIFHEFFQEESEINRGLEGTGLGLAIVKKLLIMMDSKIRYSAVEKPYGSKFSFVLSLDRINENEVELNNDNEISDYLDMNDQVAFKMLVVEDNMINMKLTKKVLQSAFKNLTIIEAENGEIAIDKFISNDIDFILMDIQMPVMNGIDATIAIRGLDDGEYVPIVAYSAGVSLDEQQKYKEIGFDNYIEKPVNKQSFLKTISFYMASSKT